MECPPTTTYCSFTDEEKTKLQNSLMRFKPFVPTGLLPKWRLMSVWLVKVDWKSQIFDVSSIHDASICVRAGVIDKVSGLRLISCKDGTMRIFSCGLRARRSLNPPATVETARLRLDDNNLERGASGFAINTATCSATVVSFKSVVDWKNLERSSTWFNPRVEVGES